MNINELEELAKEWVVFDPEANELAPAVLELIAAYREAVAEIKLCSCDEYFEGHIDKSLATAKRLGIE